MDDIPLIKSKLLLTSSNFEIDLCDIDVCASFLARETTQ